MSVPNWRLRSQDHPAAQHLVFASGDSALYCDAVSGHFLSQQVRLTPAVRQPGRQQQSVCCVSASAFRSIVWIEELPLRLESACIRNVSALMSFVNSRQVAHLAMSQAHMPVPVPRSSMLYGVCFTIGKACACRDSFLLPNWSTPGGANCFNTTAWTK